MTKVLVLGATGFIGGQIAKAALEEKWEVRAMRRDPESTGHLGDLPVEWVPGDLYDMPSLTQAMLGCSTIFHAAGFYPKQRSPKHIPDLMALAQQEINNVLAAARRVKVGRIVYTSSLSTIGQPPPNAGRMANEHDFYIQGDIPTSAYFETKALMESTVLAAANLGQEIIVLNPTAVFGPYDVHLTMSRLLIMVANGWAKGWIQGMINIVDVRDVAAAHITAAMAGQPGDRYIIGGHNKTIQEALTEVAEILEVDPPGFEIPLSIVDQIVKLGDILPFLPLPSNHLRTIRSYQWYDTRKAVLQLDLTPRPFSHTIIDSANWLIDEDYI